MAAQAPEPIATVVIVTKDRRATLRAAVASALAQDGDVEVLVVDDGSTDGTADMVRREFPAARLVRCDDNAGLVVRRNDAARLARGPVIVSIDDDAVFTDPATVRSTLADLDHPGVGAVGIPYVDVARGPAVLQRAPDDEGCWVGPVFRGTAHAVRRDLFVALGGYRELIVHQGEEDDFCLRLLAAGHVVRCGRAVPIHHHESPARDRRRMERYGRRNEQLLCATYYPRPWSVLFGAGYAAKALLRGVRSDGGLAWIAEGILRGLAVRWTLRAQRRPVTRATFALDRRLRRAGMLPIEAVLAQLPPAGEPAAGRR